MLTLLFSYRLKVKKSIFRALKTEQNWMDYTNAYCVHVVNLHVHHTGGIQMSTSDPQFSCRPTDGLLIRETNTQTRDLKKLEET
jgi:hypothetical protein